METLMIYLVKVALAIAAFYLLYMLLFRYHKQFRFNRLYLSGSLILSFIIPLITITIARPPIRQIVILPYTGPVIGSAITKGHTGIDILSMALCLYFGVVFLLFLHFITGQFRVVSIIRRCRKTIINGITVYITEKDVYPFTFFNKIVMSEASLLHPDLEMILQHEKVHADEKHTLDILLSEVLLLFQWFNPIAWMQKEAVKNNLEFLADQEVVHEADMQAYQMAMVTMAGKQRVAGFLNELNGNDLKNRIIMMKKNSNTRHPLLRKLTLLPVMILLIAGLSGKNYKSATASVPQIAVKGKVTCSENGKAIPMAIVLIKGTTTGTITDDQGNFSIKLQGKTDTLVFVTPDRLKVEIPVNGDKEMNVKLKLKETSALKEKENAGKPQSGNSEGVKEVQVIGYGIQKQEKANSDDVVTKSQGRPIQIPGEPLQAFQQNYSDSLGNRIRIRASGTGSMNEVLYIVDGQEVKNVNEISPDKIESISVLKNESATALYGEKGKNGVIIITSKKTGQTSDNVLIILDGKETTKKVADINPDEIQSVSVWKGEKATAKYGEKGKNGVIEITTKKNAGNITEAITTVDQLRKRIARSILYPKKAIEKGEEGEIKVFAYVNAEGEITQISESEPGTGYLSVDEVVVVAYAMQNVQKNSVENAPALSQEAALEVKKLPALDIAAFKGKWVEFQFKFLLQ
jgi:TonB-dependent SusC/RagA subfamily outer membrane receptor